MQKLIFVNASQVVTCAGPPRARRGDEMSKLETLEGVAVAVAGEHLAAVGAEAELRRRYPHAMEIDCAGGVLTPGLVDSHTHAVFGRARYDEQEMRAAGMDYMAVAARGGGIHSSVRDLRTRSEDDLVTPTRSRLARLASYGITTVEVKSGYGLTLDD